MTFVLVGLRRSGNFLRRNGLTKIVRSHTLQALFPLRQGLRPARELLRKFRSLRLPPLLFSALQVGRIRGGGGGSQGAPGVVSRGASSPPTRPRSNLGLTRGGSVSGRSSVARERASVSSAPSGAGEGEVARLQWTPLPAPLALLLLPARHSALGDVMSRKKFRRTAPFLYPPVFPNPRIEEQGRIVEPALGWTALVTVAVILALAPLPICG